MLIFEGISQTFAMAQGDNGCDRTSMSPRNILATIMLLAHLRMEHIVLLRNSPGNYVLYPVKCCMYVANLCLQPFEVARETQAKRWKMRLEDQAVSKNSQVKIARTIPSFKAAMIRSFPRRENQKM